MYPQQQMFWLVYRRDPSQTAAYDLDQQAEYHPQGAPHGSNVLRLGTQTQPGERVQIAPGLYVVMLPNPLVLGGFEFLGVIANPGTVMPFNGSRQGLIFRACVNATVRRFDPQTGQYQPAETPFHALWAQFSVPAAPPIESKTPPPPTVGVTTPPIESTTPPPPTRSDARFLPGAISNEDIRNAPGPAGRTDRPAPEANGKPFQPTITLREVPSSLSAEAQEERQRQRRAAALEQPVTTFKFEEFDGAEQLVADEAQAPAEPENDSQAPAT